MTTKIITFIVVGLIVLLITLVYLRSQAKKQGRLVEKQDARKACRVMGRKVKRMALFRRWTVLKGVSLRTKKRTAFIDFLIIAPFGLLALSVRGEKRTGLCRSKTRKVAACERFEQGLHTQFD